MGEIDIERVYDHAPVGTGLRFLVDRVWPRGIKREELRLADWLKDAGPSTELRKWFGHDPTRWDEFRRRYFAELDANPDAWRPLAEAAAGSDVTLLYGAADKEHNNAVALAEYLRRHVR